ncbi:MAG: hypothetical protein ACTTK0_02395 [Stomatobaculum sp.]
MNENTKSPVQLMADLLGEMTQRALDAERERDEARKSSDEWYQHWQHKDAKLKEAQAKLSAEIEEHQRTRDRLREALEDKAKGAQENG